MTNGGKTVSSQFTVVFLSSGFSPMCSVSRLHGGCKAYVWDPATVGPEDIQTPAWSCHFSGALPWSSAQVHAQRSPLFSISVEIFPPPSVNLKGTPFSFICPWSTYHQKFRHLQNLGKLSDFKGFLLSNLPHISSEWKEHSPAHCLKQAVGAEVGRGTHLNKLLSQCIVLQHFYIRHGHVIKENVFKRKGREGKIRKTMAFLALDFDLLWFSTEEIQMPHLVHIFNFMDEMN